MNCLRFCLVGAAISLSAAPTRAALVQMSGDIESFLNSINIPARDSEAFVVPSSAEIASWREAVGQLVSGNFAACAVLAEPLGYDLIEYSHSAGGNTYYILLEWTSGGAPLRGLGTYVFNPDSCRRLNVQAPHPRFEINTRAESIDTFLQLNAAFLQLAGTHRCANAACSPCSGSTSVCGGCDGSHYFESDTAHFVDNFFQAASTEVAECMPSVTSVSVHGFAPCSPTTSTSIVIVSNGTGSAIANSLATSIAEEYNVLLAGVYTGEPAGSCQAVAGEPGVAWPCSGVPLCGTTNVQGRAINGSPDACSTSVSAAPLPERFIHLEQQRRLRDPPDDPVIPGVSWQITIDAFAAVFPCQPPPGDLNCDGSVNNFDIDPFVLALTSAGHPTPCDDYDAVYPDCSCMLADTNGDGSVNNFDIDPFVELLTGE